MRLILLVLLKNYLQGFIKRESNQDVNLLHEFFKIINLLLKNKNELLVRTFLQFCY